MHGPSGARGGRGFQQVGSRIWPGIGIFNLDVLRNSSLPVLLCREALRVSAPCLLPISPPAIALRGTLKPTNDDCRND